MALRDKEDTSTPNAGRAIFDRQPEGYHKLAETLMGVHPELAIFRRFNYLESIRLLSLQAELTQLEWELKGISRQNDLAEDPRVRNYSSSFRAQMNCSDGDRRQWDLIVRMRKKMEEYDAALLQAAGIASLPCPDKNAFQALRVWLDEAGKDGRSPFLQGAESLTWDVDDKDLIALNGRGGEEPLSRWVNSRVLTWYDALLGRWRAPRHAVGGHSEIVEYSDHMLAKIVSLIASVVSSVLPALATVTLYFVQSTEVRLWIMMCLTTTFAVVLATVTSAKTQEIFAATCAFAAVEVVFIGSVNSSTSNSASSS